VVAADLESGAAVRLCHRRARRPVPGQADLRHPLAPVLLLHIAVQLHGDRRRRRRPGVFHGLRLRAEERVGATVVLGRMGAGRSSGRCRGGRAPGGGCRCGSRLAAPCSTCSICAAAAMTSLARRRSAVEGAGRSGT
jgi:hypothetical protein